MGIVERFVKVRSKLPDYVQIVVAGKMRSPQELLEVVDAGARHIGENYVQEALKAHEALENRAELVSWHMIGHLQKNKINKALPIFDVIQTVDTYQLAAAIDRRSEKAGKRVVPVFVEINIGDEDTKSGISPEQDGTFDEYLIKLIRSISSLPRVRVDGLMTMGPVHQNTEELRPIFRKMKWLFDRVREAGIGDRNIEYLSMGMSDSYQLAVEEGSNMVRIGTAIFGPRTGTDKL